MAATGTMPCLARPPAMETACSSAMPTSKSRLGNFSLKGSRPVPAGHSRRNGADPPVSLRQGHHSLPEHVGEGLAATAEGRAPCRGRIFRCRERQRDFPLREYTPGPSGSAHGPPPARPSPVQCAARRAIPANRGPSTGPRYERPMFSKIVSGMSIRFTESLMFRVR